MISFVSLECTKCPSPWFWMSRKFLLEMWGGGGSNNQEYVRKRGVCVSSVRVRTRGEGGQILAILERTY